MAPHLGSPLHPHPPPPTRNGGGWMDVRAGVVLLLLSPLLYIFNMYILKPDEDETFWW